MRLRVARVLAPVVGLGPGRRLGLWTQGCSLGCAGCVSPSLWPVEGGLDLEVFALAEDIARACMDGGLDGVTVSGGEPFEQYLPLMALALHLRRTAGVGTIVYTGFRLEELEARHPERAFAQVLEAIVDGRYELHSHDDQGWRGSTNQRMWRFERGEVFEVEPPPCHEMSASILPTGEVLMAGIPRRGVLRTLIADLDAVGLKGSLG